MAARISWSATDALPIRGRCDDHRRLAIESEDKGNESVLASLAMSALSLPTSQASTNRVTDETHFTEALGAE
jgi:hypothetical protein